MTGFWLDKNNQLDFFNRFAQQNGFDPLVMENWNKVTVQQVKNVKGGASLLKYYNGSVQQAIKSLYSDVT